MDEYIDLSQISGLNLSQYFGVWAVEESRFMAQFHQVSRMDLVSHVQSGPAVPRATVTVSQKDERSIAIISVIGLMTKNGSSLSSAGSTIAIRQAIRQAATDPAIAGIALVFDTPGGTVAGTADLAAEIRKADQRKPVYTYAEDLIASAGYWAGSQARKVYANNGTAQIGSIGTYMGTYDLSEKAKKDGIRAIVIKSGQLKGAGFPGAEVTDDQIQAWQDIVDKTQAQFSADVSKARRLSLSRVNELATGQTYMADDALSFGLIDAIGSFNEMLADLRGAIAGKVRRGNAMAGTTAATLDEIQAACPKADEKFVLEALKKGLTVDEAKSRYIENLQAQIEMREQETAEARDKAQAATAKKPGVDASLNPGRASKQTAYAGDFEGLVSEILASNSNMTRSEAVRATAKRDPEAHREYLMDHNTSSRSRTLIEDRFRQI